MTAIGLVAVTGGILSMWAGLTGQSIGDTLRSILTGQPIAEKPKADPQGGGGGSSSGGGGGGGGGGIGAT